MNSEKITHNSMNMQNDRISNQGMPNASFFSLAGLMAAAGRNMGPPNRFMGGSQGPFPACQMSGLPNDVSMTSMAMPMTGMNNNNGNVVPVSSASSPVPTTSNAQESVPPVSQNSTPGMISMQQNTRSPFPGLFNNTDWSWVDSSQTQESMNALLERGRSRNWTYEETLELISLYTSDEWQGKFGSEKKNHRAIWTALAAALSKRKEVSGDEARQRLNNLKALYNRIRRQLLNGEISSPQWEYWDPLHSFLGRPQPFLPLPPASPLPQFHGQHFQNFPNNFQNPNGMSRSSDGTPYSQFPSVASQHPSSSPHHIFGAFGFPSPIPGFQASPIPFPKKNRVTNNNDDKAKGDERKSESSQNANSSSQNLLGENSLGSTEGQEGSDDAATGALSPEQFMSEEMDQGTSSSTNDVPQRPESYKLRHNNHFNLVLESLAGDESFMDITLTAQGKAIKAHKSVLSAVSPYFRSVLKENPCQHPIIIMPRDIRFEELNNIISYIYKGEMTVATEDLPSLLKTAEVLQVTGLAPSESGNSTSGFISQMQSLSSSIFPNNTNTSYTWTSKSGTAKKTSKRNHSQSHQEQQQQQWFAENLLQPPSVDSQGRLDPQDFLTADMTCVKEEIPSDTEADEESTEQDQSQRDESTMETPPLLLDSDNRLANDPTDPLSETATDTLDNNNSHASNLPFKPGETESVCNSNDGQSDNSTTPEPNVCPHCTETHRPLSTLQSHLRLKHPSKPSFVCQCSRVFVRQSRLNDHSKNCAI